MSDILGGMQVLFEMGYECMKIEYIESITTQYAPHLNVGIEFICKDFDIAKKEASVSCEFIIRLY